MTSPVRRLTANTQLQRRATREPKPPRRRCCGYAAARCIDGACADRRRLLTTTPGGYCRARSPARIPGDNPRAIPSQVPTVGMRPPADNLPPPAEPQQAPPQTASIPGRIVDVGSAPEGVVVDAATRIVAIAKRDPNELVLLNVDTGQIVNRVPLPGFVRHLQLANAGGPVLVPIESVGALVRVELPSGRPLSQVLNGTVHDASQADNGMVFVSNEHGGTVTVLRGLQTSSRSSPTPCSRPDLASAGESMGLIDVRKNDLTDLRHPRPDDHRFDTGRRRADAPGRRQARPPDRRRHQGRQGAGLRTAAHTPPGRRGGPAGRARTGSPTTRPATCCGWPPRAPTRSSATT